MFASVSGAVAPSSTRTTMTTAPAWSKMVSMAAGRVPSPVPNRSRFAASRRLPAISTGVFSGNAVASALGAVPTRPMTEVRTVEMGRGPASMSRTSTPCRKVSPAII
ncbi:hypothetical protein D3C72_1986370 [compost metagenome]